MRLVVRIALAVSLTALPGCPSPKTSGDFHPGIRTLARFAMSGPTDLHAGVCTEGFRVGAQDAKAREVELTDPQRVTLAPPGSAKAYRDALCENEITAVDLKAGDSGFAFWVKDDAAETITIGGAAGEVVLTTATLNVHGRLALSGPATGLVGACLAYHLVYKSGTGVPTTAWKDYAVTLDAGGKGTFYSESLCTSAKTSLTFAKGDSDRAIYFSPTSSGPATLFARENSKVVDAAAFDIVMSPTALLAVDFDSLPYAFGNVTLGTTSSHTFTVRNVGGTDATAMSVGALPVSFDAPSGSCLAISSLAPNGSCTLTVRHSSTSGGAHAGSFAISFTNGLRGASFDIALTAYGVHPAPTVTTITPAAGSLAGGQPVTIDGTNFYAGVVPAIGGVNCTGVTIVSATRLTCITAAHSAGVVNVVVANTDDIIGTLTNGYRYQAAPTITLVAPASGSFAGGTAITISGTGFATGVGVTLGGNACASVVVVSATQITCTTPAHSAAPVNVVVTNADAQSGTATNGYRYLSAAVLAFAPTSPYGFGSHNTGTTTSNTFTLSNSGESSAASLAFTAPASPFAVDSSSTCAGLTSLAAGASCTVILNFSPVAGGAASSSEVVNYNDGGSPRTLTLSLTGTGLAPASLSISDGPTYDFGTVPRYVPAGTHTFTLTNTGGQSATSVSVGTLSAPFTRTATNCGATIAGGGSCTVTTQFYSATDGDFTASLDVTYATSQTASVGLAGHSEYPGFNVGSGISVGAGVRLFAQPDGSNRVVVFRGNYYRGVSRGAVFRLNADASLDTSFSTQVNSYGYPSGFAATNDASGKFYLAYVRSAPGAGEASTLRRFNADGTVDSSFNVNPTKCGSADICGLYSLRVLPSGKILYSRHYSGLRHVTLVNTDGNVDFNSAALGSYVEPINEAIPATDGSGKFYANIGYANSTIYRLNSDGTLDGTFTTAVFNGKVKGMLPQASGKLVVGGTFYQLGASSFAYFGRLKVDGTVDGTFLHSQPQGPVGAIASDGGTGFYVAGQFWLYGATAVPAIARTDVDGHLDGSFTSPVSLSSSFVGITHLQWDSAHAQLYLGYVDAAGAGVGLLVKHVNLRLSANGIPDPTWLVTDQPRVGTYVAAPDGSAMLYTTGADDSEIDTGYMFGETVFDGSLYPGIARLNADGSLSAKRYKLEVGAVAAGDCAQVTLSRRDANNNVLPSATPTTLSLTVVADGANGGDLGLFGDAGCSQPITAATIDAGNGSTQFYGRATVPRVYEIDAPIADATWVPAHLTFAISPGPAYMVQAVESSGPDPGEHTGWTGQCLQFLGVVTDQFGNPTRAAPDVTASITSGAGVYSDYACTTPYSDVTIQGTNANPSGPNTFDFYIQANTDLSDDISISATGLNDSHFAMEFFGVPTLTVTGPPSLASGVAGAIHVELSQSLPVPIYIGLNSIWGSGNVVFDVPSVSIPAHTTGGDFTVTETANHYADILRIQAIGPQNTIYSADINVSADAGTPAPPPFLTVTPPTLNLQTGVCSCGTFTVNQGSNIGAGQSISMTVGVMNGSVGVYTDASCSTPSGGLSIPAGTISADLCFLDMVSEGFYMDFASDGLAQAFTASGNSAP